MRDILLDTCVWVDLCGSIQLWPLLGTIESAVARGGLRVLVPDVVKQELGKHVPNTATRVVQSSKTRIKELRGALPMLLSEDTSDLFNHLDRVNTLLDAAPKQIEGIGERVMELVAKGVRLNATEAILRKVVDRGINKKAPFHSGAKNSTADAVILESLLEHARNLRTKGDERAIDFVSANTSDFSNPTNHNQPHGDFEPDFSATSIGFYINIARLVEAVSKELDSEDEQRRLTQIIDAGHLRDRLPVEITMPLSETCGGCGAIAIGGYRRSPGGLSWMMTCHACGGLRDTGEYFD